MIRSTQLSAIAASGAVAAGLGLGAGQFSPWFLTVALLGLFANWLGDSFDGAVARGNKAERPRVGFLINRCCDVLSFCESFSGSAYLPHLSPHLALMLLVGYLVNTIYGLMKLVVDGVHIIGVGGIGATEGRVIIGLWVVLIQMLHVNLETFPIGNIPLFDVSAPLRSRRCSSFSPSRRQGHRKGELFGSPVDADRRDCCKRKLSRSGAGSILIVASVSTMIAQTAWAPKSSRQINLSDFARARATDGRR